MHRAPRGSCIVTDWSCSFFTTCVPMSYCLRGARCMLVGANGAGKSTLLSIVGGRHLVDQEAALVHGRPAFHDTTLSAEVTLLTGNWTHTVNFVGHNVPYQAMEVSKLVASSSVGVDPARVSRAVRNCDVSV